MGPIQSVAASCPPEREERRFRPRSDYRGLLLFAPSLADTFDAMSSSRAYRQALPIQKVLAEIKQCAGTQLDPTVVEAFMTIDLSEYHAVLPGQEQSVETASKNSPATTDTRAAA